MNIQYILNRYKSKPGIDPIPHDYSGPRRDSEQKDNGR